MKNTNLLLLAGILIFSACKETVTDRYMVNSPIYMDRNEFRKAVKTTASEGITKPGKIYFKDHYIFINEVLKGIHVIDNNNPEAPVFVTFIEIPGNIDMAVRDSILFADSFTDLVALDISDINNIKEVGRVDSIFPYTLPPLENQDQLPFENIDVNKGIVVGWTTKEVDEVIDSDQNTFRFLEMSGDFSITTNSKIYSNSNGSMSVGIGGSMARFTISNNFLYTIDQYNLKAFDIDELSRPLLIFDETIGWNVETVFQYQNKLFFGTQTGMIIYNISNPAKPVYLSTYNHIRSCDPVVVDDNFAYVTLRAGNLCGEATSQLDVIDVSNVENPKWKQSYPMDEPYGLGIDHNTLFVCDGIAGLKVYNAEDPGNLQKIAWFAEVNAFDVIPFNGLLMMIATDGLYQYDYSGSGISLLSRIPIENH